MKKITVLSLSLSLGALTSCADSQNKSDDAEDSALADDTGTQDSGTQDSGTQDSGSDDSGIADSGSEDSGTQDSGLPDGLNGMEPSENLPVPTFSALSHLGEARSQADLVGQPTVMWFFPLAGTYG